jgi:hypothetical protein
VNDRIFGGDNPMILFFIANNKNIKSGNLKELENETFDKYLNIFPKSMKEYTFVDNFTAKPGESVTIVKLKNKPGFYIAKGVVLERGEYPRREEDVFFHNLIESTIK